MSQPAEDPGTGVDDASEIPPPPTRPTRNRKPSRCYNVTMTVVYFVVLILAVVALGSFGKKQAEINQRINRLSFGYSDKTCILFASSTEIGDNLRLFELHSAGVCVYMLWGLVSVAIVMFVWLVYSIVLAAIGPKM